MAQPTPNAPQEASQFSFITNKARATPTEQNATDSMFGADTQNVPASSIPKSNDPQAVLEID